MSALPATIPIQPNLETGEIDALFRRHRESITAWIEGDVRRYLSLVTHAGDFTLMSPFGGDPSRNAAWSEERIAELEAYFGGGEADVELVETYVAPGLVVFATIERQHGVVGGLPEQDWSLRVTVVYRREGEGWSLVHRHADALVRSIGLERLAALARGAASVP